MKNALCFRCVDEKTIEVLHIFSEMHTNMENVSRHIHRKNGFIRKF